MRLSWQPHFFKNDMKRWTIDVVIPTFRPDGRFAGLLEKLGKQTRPAGRVIVMNTGRENWEKAEMFMEAVRGMLEEAPREIKSAGLKLKMSVQKGNMEKSMEAYDKLLQALKEQMELEVS